MAWLKAGLAGSVVLGIVLGYFFWLRPLEKKAIERDILIKRVAEYQETIKSSQDAHKIQVEALEKERASAVSRSENLGKQLARIEANNETISCPVPSVLRDTINGL